jgi:hypothetical protein
LVVLTKRVSWARIRKRMAATGERAVTVGGDIRRLMGGEEACGSANEDEAK